MDSPYSHTVISAIATSALGEPGYLSLRRLLRSPPAWAVADVTVYVCENPNLMAIAADRVGARCAPLVCTDGMPAAAQRTLLAQLAQAGARLRYHGDFDWAGLRIANHVMRTWEARPWRFMDIPCPQNRARIAVPRHQKCCRSSALVSSASAATSLALNSTLTQSPVLSDCGTAKSRGWSS